MPKQTQVGVPKAIYTPAQQRFWEFHGSFWADWSWEGKESAREDFL